MARGYRRLPDLTAERFVDNPIPSAPSERLYRTGDLARWEADGSLHHLGRIDHQLKIRGVRIEPGEIESWLAAHPDVRQAVVVGRVREAAGRQLVAYIVGNPDAELDPRGLRAYLAGKLPEAMVPAVVLPLDEIPLTPNGKVDRGRLPEPPAPDLTAAVATDTERRLAEIWKELLDLDRPPGPDDDFFELGGHSLLAFKLFDRIAERFVCDLPENVLVEATTVRSLAARIDHGVVESSRRLVRVNRNGSRAPFAYVHAGAGGMFTLRSFNVAFGPEQPFYGLQAFSDRETSGGELLPIAETAGECLDVRRVQPEGPYLLAGHSAGGHVAFEMACRLQSEGEEVPFLALLDPLGPHTLRPFGRLVARARELTGTGPEPRRSDLLNAIVSKARDRVTSGSNNNAGSNLPVGGEDEAWITMLEVLERRYRPGRFRGRAIVFQTAESARYTGSRNLGWERYVDGPLETTRVPGGHTSMLLEPHVHTVAREVETRLRAVQLGLA